MCEVSDFKTKVTALVDRLLAVTSDALRKGVHPLKRETDALRKDIGALFQRTVELEKAVGRKSTDADRLTILTTSLRSLDGAEYLLNKFVAEFKPSVETRIMIVTSEVLRHFTLGRMGYVYDDSREAGKTLVASLDRGALNDITFYGARNKEHLATLIGRDLDSEIRGEFDCEISYDAGDMVVLPDHRLYDEIWVRNGNSTPGDFMFILT